MKIVIDNKIPFIRGVLEPHATVVYLPGGEIRRADLTDADCLLVRTRTRCDLKLLEGTRVRFIGTATIGYDHIDTRWCEDNGINWKNAPGCNSGGVAQYVTAALLAIANRNRFKLKDKTLGIIGVGHVGQKVEAIGRALGMTVLINDPPRERAEGSSAFTNLPTLLQNSNIVTIHVPLNLRGPDKTFNLVDRDFLQAVRPGATLINTSRGEVLMEDEVVKKLKELRGVKESMRVVLDVWQHEPEINRELLDMVDIATPHIAGYSLDGKMNATRMMVDAVANEFSLIPGALATTLADKNLIIHEGIPAVPDFEDYVRASYDILSDDKRLRESPDSFEEQRNNYPVRREFSACVIKPFPEGETGRILTALGFTCGLK